MPLKDKKMWYILENRRTLCYRCFVLFFNFFSIYFLLPPGCFPIFLLLVVSSYLARVCIHVLLVYLQLVVARHLWTLKPMESGKYIWPKQNHTSLSTE